MFTNIVSFSIKVTTVKDVPVNKTSISCT